MNSFFSLCFENMNAWHCFRWLFLARHLQALSSSICGTRYVLHFMWFDESFLQQICLQNLNWRFLLGTNYYTKYTVTIQKPDVPVFEWIFLDKFVSGFRMGKKSFQTGLKINFFTKLDCFKFLKIFSFV